MSAPLTRASAVAAFGVLVGLAALWGLRPLSHDDVFWHIRTGEVVVAEGRVPTTDSFSFTRSGEPWVSHEWGYGLLLYGVHTAAGFAGLVALQSVFVVAILASAGILLRHTRPGTARATPLVPALLGLGLLAAYHELKLNPALFTTLFVAWELLLLHAFRRSGHWGLPIALALLFLVWSNVHSGVLFGLMLLGFWWIEALVRRWIGRGPASPAIGRASAGKRFAFLVAMVVLTLMNPNGIETLLYPVRLSLFLFLGDLPLDMGHFVPPTPATRPGFFLLIASLLAGLVAPGRSRRVPILEGLAVLAFLLLSLRSNRFIFDFAVVSLPVLYRLHAPLARKRFALLLPLGIAAVGSFVAVAAAERLEGRLVSETFPQSAAAFIEREEIQGNLFNHQNYGGYLGWRLRAPIFWDGRNDVFGPLMKDLVGRSFDDIMDRWNIDVLVITEQQYRPFRERLESEAWALVYWDDFCAVYLRRTERFRDVIARHEYRAFPPFGVPDLEGMLANPERASEARSDLERVGAANPEAQRARFYLGLMSFRRGDLFRAKEELEEAAAIRPHEQVNRMLLDVIRSIVRRG